MRLIVISSIRWGYLWQRHQALATAAAEDGWTVDFLQPRPRNLHQVLSFAGRMRRGTRHEQPAVPTNGVSVLGRSWWFRRWPTYDLALVYLPDIGTEARLLSRRIRRIVYDGVLDWATVPEDWFPPAGWAGSERRIAGKRTAVTTTDAAGMARILAGRGIEATVVPPAADPEFALAGGTPFARRREAVLYFGSVRDEVDVPALAALATAGIRVDVVGHIERDALRAELAAAGVQVSPAVPVGEIAALAGTYRAVILPYRGERTESLVPAKFWNCVATGAWVVVHGLGAVPATANTKTTDGTQAGLERAVLDAFRTPPPIAPAPTWGARWREIRKIAGV